MHLKEERCFYGSSGARSEKPHEEDLYPGSHTGKRQSAAGRMRATLGPQQLLNSWPPSWHTAPPPPASSPADKYDCDRQNQLGGEQGGQTGRDKRPGETLLAGPAWLRPHDFAAASPNISFHGNPGEKRGAFILASEFTLSQRGGGIGHLLGPENKGCV